ncbi:MAG TPA: DUF364 domain-containing protein [Bacteroidales bacterium]|nr:DUF364 domain-containing protein [Bacteroidales bacterium]
MILSQTYEIIRKKIGSKLDGITVTDIRVGLFLTAIRLSDGSTGTSATFSTGHPLCSKESRDYGPMSPSKIKGTRVKDIMESTNESGIIASLKMSALNALSSELIQAGNYTVIEDSDPLSFVDLGHDKTITIVGAFQSYIRKISATGNKLYVLEMNKDTLSNEHKKLFVPSTEYKKVLPASDVVIITGQTLVNGTIDELLSEISDGTQVIVTGPSSGILPDILFENGVSVIGSVRITNPDILFDIVSEGGTGYHLFEHCARKISILKQDAEKPE